jgi:hypothetical protein
MTGKDTMQKRIHIRRKFWQDSPMRNQHDL